MCSAKTTKTVSGQVEGTSTTTKTALMTPWMLAYGTDDLRLWTELRQLSGNFAAKLGWRTAAVRTDLPGAWNDSATGRTAAGQYVEDMAPTLTSVMWIQGRLGAGLTSGTTTGEAFAKLAATVKNKATVVGVHEVAVQPTANSGESAIVPVTGLFPAFNLAGVMGAFTVFGVSGTLGYGLAYRTFDGDPSTPSAWTDIVNYSAITADETRNSGDQTFTPGTKQSAQIGLKYNGTAARANIRVMIAARYA